MTINLYGLTRSVYTRIARLALEEKGAAYALHEVEIFGPDGVPREHLARHPFGRIPAFEHDGFWLYETAAITRYVDEALPGAALQPAAAQQRARMSQIVGLLDAYAYRPMVWGVFVERVGQPLRGRAPDEARTADALAASERCLAALAALAPCQSYLLGAELTLADLHAYPMLRCLSLAPEGDALLGRHDGLRRWLAAMRDRASVVRTRTSFERPPARP